MSRIDRALLALRTARHLRTNQMLHLVRRRVGGRPRPRQVAAEWHEQRAIQIALALAALGPVATHREATAVASQLRDGRLNVVGHSGPAPVTWREPWPTPLFAYHAQYHDALADAAWLASTLGDDALHARVSQSVRAWIAAWSAGGSPAWDPYPIAIRAMNWLRMYGWGAIDPHDAAIRDSLAKQLDVLDRDLERDLQANHLLRDAWTLAVAPGCFAGPWADDLWHRGRDLFWRCFVEQVDEDGVHEERSPMYQARTLRDAVEVVAVCDTLQLPVPPAVRLRIAAMVDALDWMRHADGTLRLINDSAGDHGVDVDRVLERAAELTSYARNRAATVWQAAKAGFVSARDASLGSTIFVDLGVPSPPHQPAHSHAGALAFECELGGHKVVVDGGCSGYDGDPWRSYFRSTAAHSTVAIDGRDQSEMWATFRVARRARVENTVVTDRAGRVEIRGQCRPYHRPSAAHERVISWSPSAVEVTDSVPGAEGRLVESYVHFDSAWTAERSGDDAIVLVQPSARAIVRFTGASTASLHRGDRSPTCGWRARGFNDVVPGFSLRLASPSYGGEVWRVRISSE